MKRHGNQEIETCLRPVVEAMGYRFLGLLHDRRQARVQIYIDNERGIGLDDCVAVSDQLSAVLDVEDPIPQRFTLEVSSPGDSRPLFDLSDCRNHIGAFVLLRIAVLEDGRRRYRGVLQAVDEEGLQLQEDDHLRHFSWSTVDMIQLARQPRHYRKKR